MSQARAKMAKSKIKAKAPVKKRKNRPHSPKPSTLIVNDKLVETSSLYIELEKRFNIVNKDRVIYLNKCKELEFQLNKFRKYSPPNKKNSRSGSRIRGQASRKIAAFDLGVKNTKEVLQPKQIKENFMANSYTTEFGRSEI